MLTRNSQVGEFYVLQPPQVPPEVGKEKFTCDILIYDEESDRHVRITWSQALKVFGRDTTARRAFFIQLPPRTCARLACVAAWPFFHVVVYSLHRFLRSTIATRTRTS